jgi:drug/metabolite transporter (DMT)-like permease
MRQMLAPRIVGRSLADVGASFLFLVALVHMPIADVYAIIQFTPLALTAAAALLLGAGVGWRRWLATLVGLVGVLMILRPGGTGFDAYALLALGSILFVVARDLFTRRVASGVPGIVIAAASIFTTTFASLGFLAFETWAWPELRAVLLLFGSAMMLLAGHVWLIAAMRTGEIAVVAPFRYSIIVWAVLAGLLVWQELPDPITGIAIVCAAGLYTFLREHQLSRTARS